MFKDKISSFILLNASNSYRQTHELLNTLFWKWKLLHHHTKNHKGEIADLSSLPHWKAHTFPSQTCHSRILLCDFKSQHFWHIYLNKQGIENKLLFIFPHNIPVIAHIVVALILFEMSLISYQTTTSPHEEMEVVSDTLKAMSVHYHQKFVFCLRLLAVGHIRLPPCLSCLWPWHSLSQLSWNNSNSEVRSWASCWD